MPRTRRQISALAAALMPALALALPASAQDSPFLRPMDAPDEGRPAATERRRDAPSRPDRPTQQNAVMQEAMPPAVDRGELAPVMADDGSGLPLELWRGLDADAIEGLMSSIEIPPRSPALHVLWKRLITSQIAPTSGAAADTRFAALRLEALYQSGLARDATDELSRLPAGQDPLLAIIAARNKLASGASEAACNAIDSVRTAGAAIPKRLKGQAILMSGYCAAAKGDAASAGLSAELAREEGVETSPGLEALDAISIGAKPKYSQAKRVTLLDYRISEKVGGLSNDTVLTRGEPALLAALATDPTTPVDLGMPATEAAARLNALSPETLAAIYRANANAGGADGPSRRSVILRDIDNQTSPREKARLIQTFLDDAKREGLAFQAMQMMAPQVTALRPEPALGAFAGTAAEIAIASGQYDVARQWIAAGGGRLDQWLALADIADPNEPNRGASLTALEPLAAAGRFAPETLHRLATVLEALDYVVPIPLWEIANRTAQPTGGFLPETGVLSELRDAAKKKEFGHTVLLAMKSLGPTGAEGANLIALGDSIRALKEAGLEADARRLGVEALLGGWPH